MNARLKGLPGASGTPRSVSEVPAAAAAATAATKRKEVERATLIGFDEEGSTFFRPTIEATNEDEVEKVEDDYDNDVHVEKYP